MRKRHVLIVDDEFGLAEIVAEILAEASYDVTLAINGELALDRIRQRRPDAVLLDVMMPVLDGPGLVRLLRGNPDAALRQLPVVLMTATPNAIPTDVVSLVQDVLAKPFSPRKMIAVLSAALGP